MKIWSFAEVGYQETRSSALLQEQLKAAGFTVSAGVAEIPTAFVATWGSGKPVIGIVGEFDALPGLSQAAAPDRKPLVDNGPGHGCGHHLFGTASTAAAIAVKEWLAANKRGGTLRFFGTPAEEGGVGQGLHAARRPVRRRRCGGVVACRATATPSSAAARWPTSPASSASAACRRTPRRRPHRGRSALDGVEAMNAMVNLMREHVPSDTRIHYVITNGGNAPNVVPDFAEVYYYARHNDMRVLDGIWERIINAARGAALGTDTKVELELTGAVWNVLPNSYLASVMHARLAAGRRLRVHAGRAGVCRDAFARRSTARCRRSTVESDPGAAGRHRHRVDRHGRRELARADGAADRGHVGAGHARAQLAGGGGRRHVDRRQGHDGRRQDDGADGDRSVDEPGAHRRRRAPNSTRCAGPTSSTATRLADRKPALDYRK